MVEIFATERLRELYPEVRSFLEEEIYPNEAEWLKRPFSEVEPLLREKKELAKKAGAWNLYLGEEQGGPGLSLLESAQLSELLGTTPFGHFAFNAQAPDAGNIQLLLQYADESLRSRYLASMLEGQFRSCFSITEPGQAGSNPVNLSTSAERQGEEYVITGSKWFSAGADGAKCAIVMAVTNPDEPNPYQRASLLVVPTESPGYQLVRNIPVMGRIGEGWHSYGEVRYDEVRVPVANRLGGEGEGFKLAQERLGPGRVHHCMRWIGICERAFDLMCRRAATRNISQKQKLGEKQMIQHFIADSRAEIDAARFMVLHAAHGIQERGQKAESQTTSTIKFFVAGILQQVVDRAIQVHGALGVTDDTILSYFYREERGARIYGGADEAHKASVARKVLHHYGLKLRND